jgi:hypothetical protein
VGVGPVLALGDDPHADREVWCARGELNPHVLSDTRT